MTDSAKLVPISFHSAALKVKWAEQHIRNIEQLLREVHKVSAGSVFAKDNPQGGTVTMGIDFGHLLPYMPLFQMMTGDAVHNLRSALDHLAWNVVSPFKKPDPYLYFPIDVELKSLIGQKSFRDIKAAVPGIADLIVDEIKPYGVGNPFVKLNHLDRADKHRLMVVHSVGAEFTFYMAADENDEVPSHASSSFILVNSPTRIPRPGSRAALHNERHRGATFDIRFSPGLPFENEPVVSTLHQLSQLIAGTIKVFATYLGAKEGDPVFALLGAGAQNRLFHPPS